jgi:putative transposase
MSQPPPAQSTPGARATTTLRQPLEHRPGISDWLASTQALFNQVAQFYFQVLDAHPAVLTLSATEALTALEGLTHATASHPRPVMPLSEVAVQVPALFRRAAIHAALGTMRSFQTQQARWQRAKAKAAAKGKPCRLRPPRSPRTWNRSVVFYAGMWKEATAGRITLKLYDGQTWRWVRFRVFGRPVPDEWVRGSPQVVRHGGPCGQGGQGTRWWLHVPITRTRPRPQKVATQLAHVAAAPDAPDAPDGSDANPPPLLCAVDLNINDALAVCTIQQTDGTVVASRFLRGGDALHGRRKSLLGRIARRRRLTGILAEGEPDNVALWAKIRHLDEDTAHRLSRRLVDFAQQQGATILVFEHLGSFRPERGKYSRRANAKRAYWLRGKIVQYSRYKAWNVGIVTCRVNPWKTSQHCARCAVHGRQVAVARYGAGQPREGYRVGAPLVWCPVCQKEGNADYNASRNIGLRLVARQRPIPPVPPAPAHPASAPALGQAPREVQEKPPTRLALGASDEAPKGAGVACSHGAAGPGTGDGHGTA